MKKMRRLICNLFACCKIKTTTTTTPAARKYGGAIRVKWVIKKRGGGEAELGEGGGETRERERQGVCLQRRGSSPREG